jgi:muramoyltetrapeptide carboxypeptidase
MTPTRSVRGRAARSRTLARPPRLRPGDRVALVAPASPFARDAFDRGVAELRSLGFDPVFEESVFERDGYLAGSPELRAAALTRAWEADDVAAVIAVRGGFGSVHLLPYLDAAAFRRSPKILLGYSDITTLHVWLTQEARIVAFQGPMLEGRFARGGEGYARDAFLASVTAAAAAGVIAGELDTFVRGDASGPAFGGTIAQLVASLGTPYAFDPPEGHVLFLEDVGERPYRLDRMITQLMLAGIIARASAIVLGTFPECDEPGGAPSARDTLRRLFSSFPGPVVYGLPVGHVDGPALTLPLGVEVRVAAGSRGSISVEEPAVS